MEKVQSFSEINNATTPLAGGKGAVLAKLYQSGYPIPDGFIILTTAFNDDGITEDAWNQVKKQLTRLKDDNNAFAVRSSALSEDSGETSFAGEFETVLGVRSEEEIQEAIKTVWESRASERVQSYSEIHGLDKEHEIAVIVQSLVDSEMAGVLFTVDPVTGKHVMLGNYVYGLGDKLVSGEADAQDFRLNRPDGVYNGPYDLESHSKELYQYALKLEGDYGVPQDIEWAVADNKLYLLQSRPITTNNIHDPKRGYYNESLQNDYLWMNSGIGENLPGIMKPSTWSVWHVFFIDIQEWNVRGIPGVGNIAGRPYMNMSLVVSVPNKIYGKEKGQAVLEPSFGKLPDINIPLVPVSWFDILGIIPGEFRWQTKVKKFTKEIPEFIATNPETCNKFIAEIKATTEPETLRSLWVDKVEPLFIRSGYMLKTINEHYQAPWLNLAGELKDLVGKEDADLLMSTMGNTSVALASFGLMTGISKIARGELTKEEYLAENGHRFPEEWHLDYPRPYENSEWLDEQIQNYKSNPFDLTDIAKTQRAKYEEAWARFQKNHPNKSRKIKEKIEHFAELSVDREHIRNEITRTVCVIREHYLRAGLLTGLNEDVFLLTYGELCNVLGGDTSILEHIPARRETDRRLRELPEYPTWINGAFNPFTWSRDPDRRTDVYDAHQTYIEEEDDSTVLKGNPGSGGRYNGIVRVVKSLDEAYLLQKGEILVTITTNVGWTPLFPRASAVITDIGMPLAHAAIVAREIGIPAVVGVGNATSRLKTGDRVLVDGDQGIVRILES
jgi:pyruvate,water dikinase